MYEGAQDVRGGIAALGSRGGQVAGATLAPPQPMGGVPASVNALDHAIEGHRQLVEALAQRLEMAGVLRPSAPAAANKSEHGGGSCGLSTQLNLYRDRVGILSGVLADLIERLDI